MIFCFYYGKRSPGQDFPPLSPTQTQANKLPESLNILLLLGDTWCVQSLSSDYHSPLPKARLTTAVRSPYRAQRSTTWHFSGSEILSFQSLTETPFLWYPLRTLLPRAPHHHTIGEACGTDSMWPLLSAPHAAQAMMISRSHKQVMNAWMSGDMDPVKGSGVYGCKIEKEKLSHSKQIVFPTIFSTKRKLWHGISIP